MLWFIVAIWLFVFALLALNGRALLDLLSARHPRLFVDAESQSPVTAFAAMSSIRLYESGSESVVSFAEFIGSKIAIEELGDLEIERKWAQRQNLKKLLWVCSGAVVVAALFKYLVVAYIG